MKKSTVFRAAAALALIAGGTAAFFLLPIKQYVADFIDWVRGVGWWGPVVFGLVYAVTALVLPGSLLTLGAGFAFGVIVGTIVVSLGSATTAVIAFWLGRTLARGWVEAKVVANPKF